MRVASQKDALSRNFLETAISLSRRTLPATCSGEFVTSGGEAQARQSRDRNGAGLIAAERGNPESVEARVGTAGRTCWRCCRFPSASNMFAREMAWARRLDSAPGAKQFSEDRPGVMGAVARRVAPAS
jgi:hypothetical protein